MLRKQRAAVFDRILLRLVREFVEARGRVLVVGNLPYSVSKPILMALAEAAPALAAAARTEMALMLQKEVAERVAAPPGDRTYGSLSVLTQCAADVRLAFTVPPGAFRPPPAYDPAERVLSGLARTPYRHEVSVLIEATVAQIRVRLPASVATVDELPDGWHRVGLRAERLDWVPGVLALIDRPFVIERPDELRDLVRELGVRLVRSAEEPGGG